MEAKVAWKGGMEFEGMAGSKIPVRLDSPSAPGAPVNGVSPMEMVAMALGGCTAMDVISILNKKQQRVTGFEVRVRTDRSENHPKVFTHATLEYQVTGHSIDPAAVLRAIELSVEKYCSVHAMLSQVFPIDVSYIILENEGEGMRRVVAEGVYEPATPHA